MRASACRKGSYRVWMNQIILVVTALCVAIPGWASTATTAVSSDELRVGFVCSGATDDWGWNYAQNQGRRYLEARMPNVRTMLVENIPESADAERMFEKMIGQGAQLIFSTSYGYLEAALRVAAKHPDVVFMQADRTEVAKNLGTYSSSEYQPLYIAGMVAGRMTKTNKLGFIASYPVPPILQAINSFTLGARSVNPKANAKVVWINSWSDPPAEAEAAKGLSESGVDVVANYQDDQNAILRTAESLNMYSVGCWADAHKLSPKGWLTGAYLDWGPLYVKIAKSFLDHSWKTCTVTDGMEGGYIKLAAFGHAVPQEVRKQAVALQQDIKSGKFVIFKAPLKDREGKERLARGQKADSKWLANMEFFVQGVDGALPKK